MIDFNEPYATVSLAPLANVTAALRWRIFPPLQM